MTVGSVFSFNSQQESELAYSPKLFLKSKPYEPFRLFETFYLCTAQDIIPKTHEKIKPN